MDERPDGEIPTASAKKRKTKARPIDTIEKDRERYLQSIRTAPPGVHEWLANQQKADMLRTCQRGVILAFTVGTSTGTVPNLFKSFSAFVDWVTAFTGHAPHFVHNIRPVGLKAPPSYAVAYEANKDGLVPALKALSGKSGAVCLTSGLVVSWAGVCHLDEPDDTEVTVDLPTVVTAKLRVDYAPSDDQAVRSALKAFVKSQGIKSEMGSHRANRIVYNSVFTSSWELTVGLDMKEGTGIPVQAAS